MGGQIWVTTAYQQYHSGCSCRNSRIKDRLNYKSAACGATVPCSLNMTQLMHSYSCWRAMKIIP